MKKIYPYLALAIICLLALIPPCDWFIKNPYNDKWLWMITISGFLGLMTMFVETNWYVRTIAVVGFFNCFFSCIPYLSFSAYVLLVGCCWFYIVCERIEDWTPIFKALQAVLLLNVLILVMAKFHKDPLLNFGLKETVEQYGIMGHHMLMGSFAVVVASLLICYNRLNIVFPFLISIVCVSTWSFFCAAVGLFLMILPKMGKYAWCILFVLCLTFLAWSYKESKFATNIGPGSGRAEVWKKSIELSLKKPWMGWGIGSYKDIFPALNVTPEHYLLYRTAHNFVVELLFEVGVPMTLIIVVGLIVLFLKLLLHRLYLNAAGIAMVVSDASVHFPDRVTQCVPIIIALIAYSVFCLRRAKV